MNRHEAFKQAERRFHLRLLIVAVMAAVAVVVSAVLGS